jgi:hypothetical protein
VCLAIWSLVIVSFIAISQNLSRSVISSFYGLPYLPGRDDFAFYLMKESEEFTGDKFNKVVFGNY